MSKPARFQRILGVRFFVGSVQEAALNHPMVKSAQEIFKAEVRSVVDLRQK